MMTLTFRQHLAFTTEAITDAKRLAIIVGFVLLIPIRQASAQPTIHTIGAGFEKRADGAMRLTFSSGKKSCQNPAFSPDGKSILFTRFLNGYNVAGSELVVIDLQVAGDEVRVLNERVIISTSDSITNVSVPATSWVDNKICWASDRAGEAEEVFIADEDGKTIAQLTNHPETQGSFIEPVFNPKNSSLILFEHSPLDENEPHRIALLRRDRANQISILTSGVYDDRLPSWSWDERTLAFQRASPRKDDWQIYTAEIDTSGNQPMLTSLKKLSQPSTHNTDNSWFADNKHILSSSDYFPPIPNIVAFPLDGSTPKRVSNSSTREDGAPASSPDGKWIAFESHKEEDEESPSEIWIIPVSQELTLVENHLPLTPSLIDIFPNPFADKTAIRFSLLARSHVSIEVFDLFGRKIATLVDEEREAGAHTASFEASALPDGLYVYRLSTMNQSLMKTAFISR